MLLGKPTASREEVYEAAKKAFAYDFIQHLRHGFDTVVGDGAWSFQVANGSESRLLERF